MGSKELVAGLFEPVDESSMELLRENFKELYLMYKDEYKGKEGEVEVAVVRARTKVDRGFLERYENLRYVVMLGVGTDNIDLEECEKRGIKVISSKGGNANAVAELFFLHLINALRLGCKANEEVKRKGYGNVERERYFGMEVKGKTIGFVGMGAIAKEVVKKLYRWGVEIIAYDVVKDEGFAKKYGVEYVELEELYSKADVISLHVPLLPSTKGMINKDAISRMKKGVTIINLARGEVVNEKDILEGLNKGTIGFYSSDVLSGEGKNVSKAIEELVKHERTFFTPHIGGQTEEALRRIVEEVLGRI